MAVGDIDFEGTSTTATTQQQNNEQQEHQEEQTHLNGGDEEDVTGKDGSTNEQNKEQQENNQHSSTGELAEGDAIEFDGNTYTIDANGNLVDANGSIFKEAKDVPDWLNSLEVEDDNDSNKDFNLSGIQEALGIQVTDANGNPVEFTDDAEGVKAYVKSVLDLKSTELQQAAINKLYADNPLLKQFTDYVQLNGTPRGFGELPDRTGIVLNKDNQSQLEAIIKMAATEFGNKSLNDNYIKYLKDSGGLYDEARNQLAALQEKDKAYRKDIETRAQQQREQEAKDVAAYWNNVNKVIESRVIAGYKLPETLVKEVNGQKVSLTPNDFYDYLSKANATDADGNRVTGYQRDLSNLTDEDYLNRELLDAWLMFTGGSYKDLVDMAVKEDQVRRLKVRSKESKTSKSVRIVRNNGGKSDINDIVLS